MKLSISSLKKPSGAENDAARAYAPASGAGKPGMILRWFGALKPRTKKGLCRGRDREAEVLEQGLAHALRQRVLVDGGAEERLQRGHDVGLEAAGVDEAEGGQGVVDVQGEA